MFKLLSRQCLVKSIHYRLRFILTSYSIPVEVSPTPIENDDGSVNTTPEDALNRTASQTPPDRLRWKSKHDAAPRGAFFPDLDGYNTGGSSDEDEEHREAMRYLRQVR